MQQGCLLGEWRFEGVEDEWPQAPRLVLDETVVVNHRLYPHGDDHSVQLWDWGQDVWPAHSPGLRQNEGHSLLAASLEANRGLAGYGRA